MKGTCLIVKSLIYNLRRFRLTDVQTYGSTKALQKCYVTFHHARLQEIYCCCFSRLGLECLKEAIADKYHKILLQFGRDIENIQKTYQRLRHEPPVARDLPPIAGKIMWARQMFRRIQEPMEHLKNYPEILQGDDSKRIVRNYNKVAKVLLEFEVLYHQAWVKQVRFDDARMVWVFGSPTSTL